MSQETGYVIYYALFFIWLFVNSLYNKTNRIVSYINLLWAISAASAAIMHILLPWMDPNIKLLPFVYLQLCFLIYMLPIYKFSENCWTNINVSNPTFLKYFILVISIIAILPLFENVKHLLQTYISGDYSELAEIYNAKMESSSSAHQISDAWLSPLGKILNKPINYLYYSFPFFLFYYLTRPKLNKWVLGGIVAVITCKLSFELNMAGRMEVAYFLFDSVLLFVLFRKHFPEERRRKIQRAGIVLFTGFILLFSIMTIARQANAKENDKVSNAVFATYYIARPHLSFNSDMWNIKQHTQGDNSFSFYKYITGFHTIIDNFERREYWGPSRIGIPSHIFYTFFGDWFMDLGIIGTLLLTVLFSLLGKKITINKGNNISLFALYFFFIYCSIILRGWTFFSFKSFWASLLIIVNCLILYLISSVKLKK